MIRVNNTMKYLDTKILPSLIDKELRRFNVYYKEKRVCILLDEDLENYILGNCIWQHLVKNGPWLKNISTTAVYYKDATKGDVRECFYYNNIGSSGSYVRFINGEEYYKHDKGSSITKDADIIIATPSQKNFEAVMSEVLNCGKAFLVLGDTDYIKKRRALQLLDEGKFSVMGTTFEDPTITQEKGENYQLLWYTNISN